MVEALFAQVGVELARYMRGSDARETSGKLAAWRLRLIDQRLDDLATAPSLEELAALCSLSVRHLSRAFRDTRQQSLGTYVAERRAEHARSMLSAGMNIKAVAYALGFSAPSNFSRAFRRATGETPKQFRERQCSRRVVVSAA